MLLEQKINKNKTINHRQNITQQFSDKIDILLGFIESGFFKQ